MDRLGDVHAPQLEHGHEKGIGANSLFEDIANGEVAKWLHDVGVHM